MAPYHATAETTAMRSCGRDKLHFALLTHSSSYFHYSNRVRVFTINSGSMLTNFCSRSLVNSVESGRTPELARSLCPYISGIYSTVPTPTSRCPPFSCFTPSLSSLFVNALLVNVTMINDICLISESLTLLIADITLHCQCDSLCNFVLNFNVICCMQFIWCCLLMSTFMLCVLCFGFSLYPSVMVCI